MTGTSSASYADNMLEQAQWLRITAAFIVLLLSSNARADRDMIRPGGYEVFSETIMPNLEQLRHHSNHRSICMNEDVSALFPILRHNAFDGCSLKQENEKSGRYYYRIVCKGALLSTGTALLDMTEDPLRGEIRVRMGGKNMTFSQQITATRQGDCG